MKIAYIVLGCIMSVLGIYSIFFHYTFVHYVSELEGCKMIKYSCPKGDFHFDEQGCGCKYTIFNYSHLKVQDFFNYSK